MLQAVAPTRVHMARPSLAPTNYRLGTSTAPATTTSVPLQTMPGNYKRREIEALRLTLNLDHNPSGSTRFDK